MANSVLCQLESLPESVGRELNRRERAARRLRRLAGTWLRRARKSVTQPAKAVRRVCGVFGISANGEAEDAAVASAPTAEPVMTLDLRPGERVRVKEWPELKKTLDENGCTEGCGFLKVTMLRHCGQTYTVGGRVRRFFDERRWRMLRVKNMVRLESVFCEPPAEEDDDFAGCDRKCYLFWKEAWLERVKE